jgi:hypothetical protein
MITLGEFNEKTINGGVMLSRSGQGHDLADYTD